MVINCARQVACATAILLASQLTPGSSVHAQDAQRILKAMSDHIAGQKSIAVTFDADIEVLTTELQKIQFTSSGQIVMTRPDKLHATRRGGYADVEMVFDGTTVSVAGKHNNIYTQAKVPGSIDKLVDQLRDMGVAIPGADLILARVHEQLLEDVIDAKYVGHGVIDGVDCEHLAFRTTETDWQIWVEIGPRPVPRKYIITSKTVTAAPQYTLRIKSWTSDPKIAADAFVFKPPSGAKLVDIKALTGIDEVPAGVVVGGRK